MRVMNEVWSTMILRPNTVFFTRARSPEITRVWSPASMVSGMAQRRVARPVSSVVVVPSAMGSENTATLMRDPGANPVAVIVTVSPRRRVKRP